jgi:hypothetical protein
MIIAGDKIVLSTSHFAFTILGMPLIQFVLVAIIVALLSWQLLRYMWNARQRNKHILEAKGKVLLEFTDNHGGKVERVLCTEFKGEARKEEHESRGTFTIQNMAKVPGHSIDCYFLLPEHDYLDTYPYDVPECQQIQIKKFYFTKNCPWPNIPHDASKWDTERYVKVTSTMAKLAKDESNLQVLVSEMSGIWEPMMKALEQLKHMSMIKILGFVQIVMLLIVGYFGWANMNAISAIAKFITGAK